MLLTFTYEHQCHRYIMFAVDFSQSRSRGTDKMIKVEKCCSQATSEPNPSQSNYEPLRSRKYLGISKYSPLQ